MERPDIFWNRLALAAGLAHFLLTAAIGLSRHWAYLTSINDLGVFDQAIWGILNGAPFLNTSNEFDRPINWLGFHFNPVLAAFVPFYLAYPAAEWLIVFQSAALALAAWPLYLFAKAVGTTSRTAFLWTLAYLFNPFVLSTAVWDFHPVSLAAPLMALGVLAVERKQPRLFGLACLSLLLIQEQLGLAVAAFGVLWWLRNRSLKPAFFAMAIGMAYTLLVFLVLMPALSPTGSHVMLSSGLGQLSRYGWLGDTAWEAIKNVVVHPLIVLEAVFVEMDGGLYLGLLLLPFLATPLAGLQFLMPGMADLLANLMSANSMPRSVFAYHSITLTPLLVAAGIYGSSRIGARFGIGASGLAATVLWASLVFGYLVAPLPLPYAMNFWQPMDWPHKPDGAVAEILSRIPPEATISVQGNLGAHFSQRAHIYAFPNKVNEAHAVVLRLSSPTRRIEPVGPYKIGALKHHLLLPPAEYLEVVENLLESGEYGIAYWKQPWLVLSRGVEMEANARQAVRLHLLRVEEEWLSAEGEPN